MTSSNRTWGLSEAIKEYSELRDKLAGTCDIEHYKWVSGLVKSLEELKVSRKVIELACTRLITSEPIPADMLSNELSRLHTELVQEAKLCIFDKYEDSSNDICFSLEDLIDIVENDKPEYCLKEYRHCILQYLRKLQEII